MSGSQRHLAAVLFTDLVGYSALTQRNEALALRLLRDSEGIVRSAIEGHRGREVKTLGDGFLAEFGSALSATECAIAIQRAIHEHNAQPGAVSIDLRVGVHLGDVEHRDGDIFGDAVNIASRVEALAEPGGICLTGAVVEQVRNKLPYACRELGPVSLKNISQTVPISRVVLPWIEAGEAGLTPWTGRQRELQTLVSMIDATRRREGRILFIRGEPGIGKTRLVQEALRHDSSSGLRVLRSRALPGEPCPPFGYWAEAAREFFRDAPPALAFKACGDRGAEVVKLVPELADRLGQFASVHTLDPDQERPRFYEGITQLFLNIAKESPLVIFFDDMQLADTSSLRLLHYIARRLPGSRLLIIAACRDYDPEENPVLREVMEDLDRQHLDLSVALPRLPEEDVVKIAQFILGSAAAIPHFTPKLFQKTGGNPFFVEEVLRSVLETGTSGNRAGGPVDSALPELQLPENVRHAIQLRLGRLNPKTVEILGIASVIGVEFSFEVLGKATTENEETLIDALEEALQVRVLRERRVGGAQALYSFADDQIRDALYEEISLVRSRSYHRRVGEALELLGVSDQPEGAEVLAHHFLRGNEPAKALKYLVRAGDRAAEVYATEQAVARYSAALDLLARLPDNRLRLDVLDRQGTQLGKLGEVDAQVKAWEKALEGYLHAENDLRAGELLRRLGTLQFRTRGKPEEGKRLLVEARRLLEKGPVSPELARLYLDLLDREESEGNAVGAAVLLVKALETADRLNDPGVMAEIRARRGGPLQYDDAHFRQDLAQHLEYGLSHDPEIALQAYWQLAAVAALGRGDFVEAREWALKGIAFAEKTGNVRWAMTLKGVTLAFASITLGDLETASKSLQEYHDFLEAHHEPPDGRNLRLFGEMALLRGQFEEAERWFEQSAAAGSPLQPWLLEVLLTLDLARLEAFRGNFERAEERLTEAMPAVRTSSAKGLSWFLQSWFLALLVEVLLRQKAMARAAPFLVELENASRAIGSYAGRGLLLRAQGQSWVASGDLDQAARSLEESVEAWRASGWAIELARTEVELAEVCRVRGEPERARQLAESAITALREFSSGPDAERAKATLSALATP